jgi:hypothetical protein
MWAVEWIITMLLVVLPSAYLAFEPAMRHVRWRPVARRLRQLGFQGSLFRPLELALLEGRLRFHNNAIRRAGDTFTARFVAEIPVTRWVFRVIPVVSRDDRDYWRGDAEPSGAPDFDARFGVLGPPSVWMPVLNAATRALLMSLPAAGWVRIDRGIEALVRRPLTPEQTEAMVRGLEQLAQQVNRPLDPAQALVEGATEDPHPAFRARCLRLLRQEFPNSSETLVAATSGLTDDSPGVRLEAARVLNHRPTLVDLARQRRWPTAVRGNALLHLAGEADAEVRALLLHLLRDVELGPAPWRALAILGGPIGLDELPAPPPSHEPEMRIAAAACFALVGPPAEPVLLSFLADESLEVATAAAEALARAGTSRSIGPLRARLPRFPLSTTHLNRAITHTLAALGTRAQQHGGSLSLTEADGGGLSEPPTP